MYFPIHTPPGAIPFTATVVSPVGNNPKGTSFSFSVQGGEVTIPPADQTTLMIKQMECKWEGFAIAGVSVVKSLMTAIGTCENGRIVANGYDWTELANGDHLLAQWQEVLNPLVWIGIWEIVSGTGKLQGIHGIASFQEIPPPAGATTLKATVSGWYRLPAQNPIA